MILKRIKVTTPWGERTNCYIVKEEKSGEAMVVDPGGSANEIIEMLDTLGIDKIKYIYLTHCHADHIGAVEELKKQKGGKILIHVKDAEGLHNNEISLTGYLGMDAIYLYPDSRVNDMDLIHLGNLEFQVLHTPGHTQGGTCLYCENEKLVFSGDTIFRGTWGRTDLPTSSFTSIMDSINNKIMDLPEDVIIYPGHGKMTMLKEERPIYLELKPRLD